MYGSKIALRDAILRLHDLIQLGDEAPLPRLARLQLAGILGQLEQALVELEADPPPELQAEPAPAAVAEEAKPDATSG